MALSKHMGTIRMIASGKTQLSYCAASTRKTNSTQRGKMKRWPAAAGKEFCWKRQVGPLVIPYRQRQLVSGRQPVHGGDRLARSW